MNQNQEIQIHFRKAKLILYLLLFIFFVMEGVWMIYRLSTFKNPILNLIETILMKSIGAASIIFFGMGSVACLLKLLDNRPGLVINQSGITVNTIWPSAMFISWSEICEIGTFTINGQKMVAIKVCNPEKYVKRGNAIERKLRRHCPNLYGSSINISANSLKIKFQELVFLLEKFYSVHVHSRRSTWR